MFETPFPVSLMNEEMDRILVVQRQGFIYFKSDENDNDVVNPLLRFISPLRANFEIKPDLQSEVSINNTQW